MSRVCESIEKEQTSESKGNREKGKEKKDVSEKYKKNKKTLKRILLQVLFESLQDFY